MVRAFMAASLLSHTLSYDPVEWCTKLLESDLDVNVTHFDAADPSNLKSEVSLVPNFKCPPPVGQGIQADDPIAVPLPGTDEAFLAVYRRQLLGDAPPSFAFIQLHGDLLDAHYYFRQAIKAVPLVVNEHNPRTRGKTAVVFAPAFGNKNCTKQDWLGVKSSSTATTPAWNEKMWTMGIKAHRKHHWKGISTFEALDTLVKWVDAQYHQLEKIVLLGFSAGAMMGMRWAAVSEVGVNGKTRGGTDFQMILGSPSSPVYLDAKRPANKCTKILYDGLSPRFLCDKYSLPDGSKEMPTSCKNTWNEWPAGLDNIDEHMNVKYAGSVSAKDLRHRFASKNFWFSVGDLDFNPCNVGGCKGSCDAMVKGSSRLQRVLNFAHHLEDAIPGYKPKYQVFGGGHAYYHMLCGAVKRPQFGRKTSAFINAFNEGPTAQDFFQCSMDVIHKGFNGNHIEEKEAFSTTECCSYCADVSDCTAWSFAAKYSGCTLWSSVTGQWDTDDFVGGVKGPSPPTPTPPAPPTTTSSKPTVRRRRSVTTTHTTPPAPTPPTTTPAKPTTVPDQCSVSVGFNCKGQDISKFSGSSPVDCCKRCSATKNCFAFTFYAKSTNCRLKSDCSGKVPMDGATAGSVTGPAPVPTPVTTTYLPPTPIPTTPAPTPRRRRRRSVPTPPSSCAAKGEDPFATGSELPCCHGLTKAKADWDGDAQFSYRCVDSTPAPPTPTPTPPSSCARKGEDPFATGSKLPCCHGLTAANDNWDGDDNYYYKCVSSAASFVI